MAKKSNKKDIVYGDVELTDEDTNFGDAKIRITTMIDMGIYKMLKTEAASKGMKYQSLLNQILRAHFGVENSLEGLTLDDKFLERIFGSDAFTAGVDRVVKKNLRKNEKSKAG